MTRPPEEPRPLLNGGAESPDDQAAALLLSRLPAVREDRVARERIRRALGQARRRPHWEWRPLAALAGAGVAVVALVLSFGSGAKRQAPAILELAAGHVLLGAAQGDWFGGQAGACLAAESRVRTDGTSRAMISLARSAVVAEAATDVGLEALGPDTLLRLSGGRLVAEVDPRRANESFVILTTRYRVTVKGTIFSVREQAPDDVEVSVSRGRVEVAGAGEVWSVAAGQLWSSRHPSALAKDSITEAERRLLDGAIHPGPRSPIEVVGDNLLVSAGGVQLRTHARELGCAAWTDRAARRGPGRRGGGRGGRERRSTDPRGACTCRAIACLADGLAVSCHGASSIAGRNAGARCSRKLPAGLPAADDRSGPEASRPPRSSGCASLLL